MAAKNSKKKANAFEWEVARGLSKWIGCDSREPEIVPSRSSGGWAARGWRNTGDLAPNGPLGEIFLGAYAVECKVRANEPRNRVDFWQAFTSAKWNVRQWWTKINYEAERTDREPLLVLRQNRMTTLVGMAEHVYEDCLPEHLATLALPQEGRGGLYLIRFDALLERDASEFCEDLLDHAAHV